MRSTASTKDLRAAIAWLDAYPVGQALPEVDPNLTPQNYAAEAAKHARQGHPESEAISLAKMHLAKEIKRRQRLAQRRSDMRVRYRGKA